MPDTLHNTQADQRSTRRLEDARLLLGRGRYLEDIAAPTALAAYVLRSPHAHALIHRVDIAQASARPGVHLIATAVDLAADGLGPLPCMAAVKPLIVPPRPALAEGRVRHVGDPVAFVVAQSAEIAREAAELIEVDYEPLPSVVDGRAAIAAGLEDGQFAVALVYEDRSLASAAAAWTSAGGSELFSGGVAIDDLEDALSEGTER